MLYLPSLVLLASITLPAATQQTSSDLPPATDRLLVCNKVEHTVSIFAIAERKEIAVLPTGDSPHEVAVSPDGRTAIVSNYGGQKPGHTLTIVDVVAAKVLRTVELPQPGEQDKFFLRPHGVQFVSNEQVIFTSESAHRLVMVNVHNGKLGRTWASPQPTMHMVSVTQDGKHAAATSIRDGTVAFFDLTAAASDTVKAIRCGTHAEGLAVHPITGDAWIGNRGDNSLSIVSAQAQQVVRTLKTGDMPFRIAFTADHAHVLVTCAESGELQIYDAAKQELAREVSIHGDRSEQSSLPLAVVCGPDSRFAYVTCARGEFVAIVDLQRGELVDRIDARKGPDGIAYARPPVTAKAATEAKR
jgi:DNA-binding beta-propeller fold protein YncE